MSLQRKAVKQAWESYQKLVLTVQLDPFLAADPLQQLAVRNAHARWAKAFNEWDGR